MRGVCVERDVLLSYLLGDEKTALKIKQISKDTALFITSFTLAEISLISMSKNIASMVAEAFEVLPFDERGALVFRNVYDALEEMGKPDKRAALEASIAIVNNVYLLVKNKEKYSGIESLKLLT